MRSPILTGEDAGDRRQVSASAVAADTHSPRIDTEACGVIDDAPRAIGKGAVRNVRVIDIRDGQSAAVEEHQSGKRTIAGRGRPERAVQPLVQG